MSTITMRELVDRFMHYISEIELDKAILFAAQGEQPITTNAKTKYNITRKKILSILTTMEKTPDPEDQESVRSMRERFLKEYPEE